MDGKFVSNVFKVTMSNVLIVLSGVISGFMLPKLLGVTDYGFYKIFNLYITYTIFCDLGISNGIFLHYGGCKVNELPKYKFRLYFKFLFVVQIIFFTLMTIFTITRLQNEYKFIFIFVGLYMIVNNIATYFEKISIMTGEFDASVRRNIYKCILSIIAIIILWIFTVLNIPLEYFKLYIVLFVCVYTILAVQYIMYYKELVCGKSVEFSDERSRIWILIKDGFILLLADMMANLILTLDKQFVSMLFDINTYSIYSFASSMLKIVILAISAIAMVLYPTLKRMSKEELEKSYGYSISIVGMISFGCLLSYYPLCVVVNLYLQEYIESLQIFRMLFPGIAINSIISMVMINHYKALSKQKLYFGFSLVVLMLAAVLNIVAYFISKTPLVFSMAAIITMIIWYIISDICLSRMYKSYSFRQYIYIVLNMVTFYVITNTIKNYYIGFLCNLVTFAFISYIVYYDNVNKILKDIKRYLCLKRK